jgi:hypothetical protein
MSRKSAFSILLAISILFLVTLACDTSSDDGQGVRTLVAESSEEDISDSSDQEPAVIESTYTPEPTEEPEVEGLVPEGTSLVGTDIEPGIYVGLAGEFLESFNSCYWERLNALSGEFDAIIANDNAEGLFYLEVLDTDKALTTGCELLPIDKVTPPAEKYTEIERGMYIVGRDIDPGTWRGNAEDSCYWERLSCVNGTFDCIIANDNAEGQFFAEISPNDFAFSVSCNMEKVE